MKVPKSLNSREVEIALLICSKQPERIVEELLGLAELCHYSLCPRPEKWLCDRYFDTEDGSLASGKIALRLREVDHGQTPWLTLKGPSHARESEPADRLEIEELWSAETLLRIRLELSQLGVSFPEARPEDDWADPLETLKALGFRLVQTRETVRKIRDVLKSPDSEDEAVAELVIDMVTYHFAQGLVHLDEIEIEAKAKGGRKAIEEISNELINLYPGQIRQWPHSKIATGKAIERILRDRQIMQITTPAGYLLPEIYLKLPSLIPKTIS